MHQLKIYHLDINITLLEDTHSGSGTGTSVLDSIQVTDRNNKPTIRASHIMGLLKEAAHELQKYKKIDPTLLFGQSNKRSKKKIILSSLRTSSNKPNVTWTSTSRQLLSRNTKPESLRTIEYIPSGTNFNFKVEIRGEKEKELFDKCLQRIRFIGSNKTRGNGLVQIKTDNTELFEPKSPPQENVTTTLRLLLKNVEALNISKTAITESNNIASENFIPGKVVLGSFANWTISNLEQNSILLSQYVSVGNAYPLPCIADVDLDLDLEKCDIMPFPLSIYKSKRIKSNNEVWWAGSVNTSEEKDLLSDVVKNEDDKRPKNKDFLFQEEPQKAWQRHSPITWIHMRNNKKDKALFSEEEIAENTLFICDIHFENTNDAKSFWEQSYPVLQRKSWLTVGRGGRPVEIAKYKWLSPKVPACSDKDLLITLESDLIIRTPQNNFYTYLSPKAILAALDMDNIKVDDMDYTSYCETKIIRGFNTISGLPRAPIIAIAKGSCIRIQGELANTLRKELANKKFLGERSWEGFGRFRLDFCPLNNGQFVQTITQEKNDRNSDIAKRENMIKKAHCFAQKIASNAENTPNISQWQYLRQKVLTKKTSCLSVIDEVTQQPKLGKMHWQNIKKLVQELKTTLESFAQEEDKVFFVDVMIRHYMMAQKKEV